MSDNLLRLQTIFRDVLDDPSLQIDENFSMDNCADWDSVAQIQILLAVEAEFGIRFSTDDIATIRSAGDILRLLGTESGHALR